MASKKKNVFKAPVVKTRNLVAEAMSQRNGDGRHHTRTRDVATGRKRQPKHRNQREW
jgi:hypothetical protein